MCVSMEGGTEVVCVQLVTIRSALFWVICSFCMYVAFVSGCHVGLTYVSIGLMYCLYTRVMSSLDRPNFVLVTARRILREVFPLMFMLSVCGMNFMLLLCVIPSVVAVSV